MSGSLILYARPRYSCLSTLFSERMKMWGKCGEVLERYSTRGLKMNFHVERAVVTLVACGVGISLEEQILVARPTETT